MAFALPPPPPPPVAPTAAAYSLAFDPPSEGESEGWTLQGTSPEGEVVTLHLRWNGEAWTLLDGIGNPATAALLRPLGLVVRGAGT